MDQAIRTATGGSAANPQEQAPPPTGESGTDYEAIRDETERASMDPEGLSVGGDVGAVTAVPEHAAALASSGQDEVQFPANVPQLAADVRPAQPGSMAAGAIGTGTIEQGSVRRLRQSFESAAVGSGAPPGRPSVGDGAGTVQRPTSFLAPPPLRPRALSEGERPTIREPVSLPGSTHSRQTSDGRQPPSPRASDDGRPVLAEWRSGEVVHGNAEPRYFGNISAGNHLLLLNNLDYAHAGRNGGLMTSDDNAGTTRLETNNKTFTAHRNQAVNAAGDGGHVILDTNHGHARFTENAGTVTNRTNDRTYESRDAQPGAKENIGTHNHKMVIVDSQADTHIGVALSGIQLGEGAQAGMPAKPGLKDNGTLTIGSFQNGTVKQYVSDSTPRVVADGILSHLSGGRLGKQGARVHVEEHKAENGKPLELNAYGKPGFFSPAATLQAGAKETAKTYLLNPYNAAGGAAIYFANAPGVFTGSANADKLFNPAPTTSAVASATSTAVSMASEAAGTITKRK